MTIFTIGHTKKSLRRFVTLLRDAGVDAVVDVRLRNTSQLAGFSKRDDLAFILELVGIAYHHRPELAPDEDLLANYRRDRDWPRYERQFAALMEERGALGAGCDLLAHYGRPCLLCAEDKPAKCHRRLLAESLATTLNADVKHLV